MPEDVTAAWRTMSAGAHPWEGTAFISAGRTEINAMVNRKDVAAGKTNIGYTLTLNSEGTLPEKKMKSDFSWLESGLKISE